MIGFVGLSHLGLVYSLATAAKGFGVVAFHPDAKLADQCSQGRFPIEEPGFVDLFHAQRERIAYTADPDRLGDCDLVFFALDIRTDAANRSDTAPLTQLIEETLPRLRADAAVVILSQVSPGYTRRLVDSLTARGALNGRTVHYQVETLIFGAAVQRAMEPERYIVGAADPASALPPRFAQWHATFGCPVLVMRYESAELAKIAINFFLVSSVTTTNVLAEVCESIGADWSEIVPALRLDKRIGPHAYLKPGLGVAGGNLERDLVTILSLPDRSGADDGVIRAWQHNSAHRRDWPLRTLRQDVLAANPQAVVAVWGLTYKQDTHSIKNSPSLALLAHLREQRVRAHDPMAELDPEQFGWIERCATPVDAVDGADVLVVMTPWALYGSVDMMAVAARMRGRLVLDPHGVLDAAACRAAGLTHRRLGC
jgi:UDPglucose 6-dehydrogenase